MLILFLYTCILCLLSTARGVDFPLTLEALNASRHDKTLLLTHHISGILGSESQIMEQRALEKLIGGLERYIVENEPITGWIHPRPFQDLIPAFFVHPFLIHNSDGAGDNEKYFIGTHAIEKLGLDYNVYAAGIAGQPRFENAMSGLGSTVSAFDCTDWKRWNYNFIFYDWCLGKPQSFEGSEYAHGQNTGQQFYSLKEIKEKLGHKKVHMLKMDIEGFEWDLLKNEIIDGDEDSLPEQLLFELHTDGSNPKYVPPHVVSLKRINEVNLLIYGLWLRGYRLTNVEVNSGDSKCAELSFIRIVPHDHH
jgi:hypothetical protein